MDEPLPSARGANINLEDHEYKICFDGTTYQPLASIKSAEDADQLRYDSPNPLPDALHHPQPSKNLFRSMLFGNGKRFSVTNQFDFATRFNKSPAERQINTEGCVLLAVLIAVILIVALVANRKKTDPENVPPLSSAFPSSDCPQSRSI